jgi:hypothetical protein
MLSPKYDLNNYIKHLAVPVITDNQRIKQLFRSSLLRVKWNHNPLNKQAFNDVGILRIHIDTPFGLLRPQDYQLQVDVVKKTYVQFISISPKPEFNYEIEIISPVGMTRSMIEIWEYVEPKSPSNQVTMPTYQPQRPQDNSDLVAAINAQTAATVAGSAREMLDTRRTTYSQLGAVQVAFEDDATRGLTITSVADAVYRIFVGDDLTVAPLFSDNGYEVEIYGINAVHELASGWNSNVWVVANSAVGEVNVRRTFVKSAQVNAA